MEGAHNHQQSTRRIGHRPRRHVQPATAHSFLGPAFRHPTREIDGGFRGFTIPELPALQVEDEDLRTPPAMPPVTKRLSPFQPRLGDPSRGAIHAFLGPAFRSLLPAINARARLSEKRGGHHEHRAQYHHRQPEPEEDAEEEAFHGPVFKALPERCQAEAKHPRRRLVSAPREVPG